ncbi:MAG: hypothetical protein R2860_14825 [Desulfobacterales bacterium]
MRLSLSGTNPCRQQGTIIALLNKLPRPTDDRSMLVVTDDKAMPRILLTLSGNVTLRAYLSTDTIRLTGSAKGDQGGTHHPLPHRTIRLK